MPVKIFPDSQTKFVLISQIHVLRCVHIVVFAFKSTFPQSPIRHNIRNQYVMWLRLLVCFCPFSQYLAYGRESLERLVILGGTELYSLN